MIIDEANNWQSSARQVRGTVALQNGAIRSLNTSSNVKTITDGFPRMHDVKCTAKNINLIPYPYETSGEEVAGVTCVIQEDGGILLNGTPNSNKILTLANEIGLPAGTYSFLSSAGDLGIFRLLIFNNDGSPYKVIRNGIFTITEDKYSNLILAITSKTPAFNNAVYYPMLRQGEYENSPYVRYYDLNTVSFRRVGKNLFSINDAVLNAQFNTRVENNEIVYENANGTDFVFSYLLDYEPGKHYKISLNNTAINSFSVYKLDGTLLQTGNIENDTINFSAIGQYISQVWVRFKSIATTGKTRVGKIQIEQGNNATEYLEYTEQIAFANDTFSSLPNMTIINSVPFMPMTIQYLAKAGTPTYLTGEDNIKSIAITREGEMGKFFGFGVCQKLVTKLVGYNDTINDSSYFSNVGFRTTGDYISAFPLFFIETIERDENTNEIAVTAYDALYRASAITLAITPPYKIIDVALACADALAITNIKIIDVNDDSFNLDFPNGANLDGTESVRELLDGIAQTTQTIYYLNADNVLVFKRLTNSSSFDLSITKSDYFELDSASAQTLTKIVSATELGDNVEAGTSEGVAQYVRNNPFWVLRNDIDTLVNKALAAMNGLTIFPFDCTWRGNPCLEIGDKIALTAKDDSIFNTFVLNDSLTFDGGLKQKTQWSYENELETDNNPSSLGSVLKKTFAQVDKANAQIRLVAAETTQLQLDAEGIKASVTALNSQISTKMDANEVSLVIDKQLANGVTKVSTATGFTFDNNGLKITKSNSEINTVITEDGMKISKNNTEMLVADNQGVKAEDLHATTYLIIGNNSRFEDYESNRTGCFFIG